MRSSRFALAAGLLWICGALLALGFASSAQADLFTKNGRFVWKSFIAEGDPVNLFWGGGTDNWSFGPALQQVGGCANGQTYNGTSVVKAPICVDTHFREQWRRDGYMSSPLCGGSPHSGLIFKKVSGGNTGPVTDELQLMTGQTESSCDNEYHVRMWGDTAHGHNPNDHRWVVTPIHHERCTNSALPDLDCGHKIDKNWETVEVKARNQLGFGLGGDNDRCTYYDWHNLPGTEGNYQHAYSDGKVTRISFQNTGVTCNGA